jgi:hypothetical protein
VGKNLTSFHHLVGCSVLLAGSGVSPWLVAFDWHLEGWAVKARGNVDGVVENVSE